MAKKTGNDKLFDINKFSEDEGIVLFCISMSRIGNAQSPQKCFEYLHHLASKIEYTNGIGLVFLYGDYLYLQSDQPAFVLRSRFLGQMVVHRNALMKLLRKDRKWTLRCFSYKTFGQLILDNAVAFQSAMKAVHELYKKDLTFKKHVQDDCLDTGHQVGEREVDFILEEIAALYLAQKGVLKLDNKFILDSEVKWILQVYPGKPLKSEIYLFQKNPLKLSNPKNVYENSFYDLEEQVLYDYLKEC